MFAPDPGYLTYAVVTDELVRAAASVRAATDIARDAVVADLPDSILDVGHDGLAVAVRDFCARWDTGLSHLVGDSETMAHRLEECADAYLANEQVAEGGFQALLSSSPRTVRGPLSPGGPVG